MMVLKDSSYHFYVIIDSITPIPSPNSEGRIIGCASLCRFHSPTGAKAPIEDVVVFSDYRGQHLGKKLMEYVLEQAKAFASIKLHLTSNPKRIAANNLYQSLRFQKKETNCYRMEILGIPTESTNNDTLGENITYLIAQERVEGNMDPLSSLYIFRIFNVPLEEVLSPA